MLLEKERELIVEYGKKLIENNLTKGTGGNLSIFNREKKLMAISPSGIEYHKIQLEDVVIIDLDGNIVDGTNVPSSECDMHRIFYKYREDIDALIHTHTVYATTIACMNWDLPSVHYLVAFAGANVVKCAKYATYGTPELATNAYEAMVGANAVLLANHGLLAGGKDIGTAYNITEEIEYCAELYYRTKSLGNPVILDEAEMTMMKERFKNYGQRINTDVKI